MLENIIVHGRCISLWHSHRLNEAHNPYSQDMMLQDSQCYYISNFAIAEKSGRLPLLPHKYKISFYKGTMVTRIDDFDNNANGFILEPFNRLLDGTRQYHEHEAVGTCWARLKEQPEYDESQFKLSLFTPQKLVVTIAEFFHGAIKKMVSRIRESEQILNCIVYAKIHRIHKENGWAYTAYKECNKKVNVVESKAMSSAGKSKVTFYCEDHGAVQFACRYKVIMRIIDQYGSAPIVFFNTNKISEYTASELIEKHDMNVDKYWPGELLDLVGKRFLFKLYYSDYNVNNNHTYRCDAVNDEPAFVKHFKEGFLDEETPTSVNGASGSGGTSGTSSRRLKHTNDNDSDINRIGYFLHFYVRLKELPEYDKNQFKISLFTPQKPVVTISGITYLATSAHANALIGSISALKKMRDRPRGRPRLPDISTGYKHKCATAIHADAVVRSVGNLPPTNNNNLKSNSDVGNITLTPPPKGRQRITDIPTRDSKNAASKPRKAVVKSIRKELLPNNNTCKRTRTPNGEVSESARINLTPRPRGRPRLADNSTRTPFQDVTPVGSLAFNSTIVNGINIVNTVGETSTKDYIDYRDSTFECSSCGALLWYAESMRGATNACSESYSMCCGRGKVELTNEVPEPPPLLKELITNQHPKSANFIDNIRRYNSMFAFTSMGGKQDTSVNTGQSPYCYRLHGENYHLARPLLPETGKPTKFAQLYIFDTENEIQNRISTVSYAESSSSKNGQLDYKLTTDIRDLLDEINSLVKDFRMAGERIRSSDDKKVSLRDGRQYNLPTASEVASLIVGDFDSTEHKRDVILQCQDGDFKRISELHPSYLALHYPLFFPYGEDNYHTDIFHEGVTDYDEKKQRNTCDNETFVVDAYTMIESEILSFNRKNDKDMRSETYSKLATLAQNKDSGVKLRGKKVVLNSAFTGSPRYMMQNYLDAITLCLKSEDRPDVISRMFKIKLDCLMKEIKDDHTFGRVEGVVYTIEFQKRGLPHCHILLWLEAQDKLTTTGKIDKYISSEIPNKDDDPELYQLVTDHMMHGPCGADNLSFPCTVDYKCTKNFPKQFNESTVINDSGYVSIPFQYIISLPYK
ncbi:putative PIF1 DNA helicase/replication protein A1-like protein [Tanacetum coccineum]